MACKFCDEYSGICTNPESPMLADCCPVPDTEGVCRYEDLEEVYKLTQKGCANVALLDADLIKHSDDPRVDTFWGTFSELMQKNGYVEVD